MIKKRIRPSWVALFALPLLAGATSAVGDAAKTQTVSGWISDSKCGAKGANAGATQCTKKCLENGAKMVVVTDEDQRVLVVENPDALKGQEGRHVDVTGQLNGESIHVEEDFQRAASQAQTANQSESARLEPLTDFVDSQISRDIRARLGNCGGKIRVTGVRVADKLVEERQAVAEIEITADWVAKYDPWLIPMACLGFSQTGGSNQKARMRALYIKWQSGWKFERFSME